MAPIGIPDGAPVGGARRADRALRARAGCRKRGAGSTKFTSGQVVVVGGSRGLTGAVCMSAEAAIRAGAGYATVAVPADLEPIFEAKLTEVMSVGCASREGRLRRGRLRADPRGGRGRRGRRARARDGPRARDQRPGAASWPSGSRRRWCIDADGLNAHAGRLERLARARGRRPILTPHEGELGRLLETDSERVKAQAPRVARDAGRRASGAIVVLKGDDTIVTDGDRVAVNRIGSPALATAGTGDVLSGHDRGADRPRAGPLRRRLRRRARPRPRRAAPPPSAIGAASR